MKIVLIKKYWRRPRGRGYKEVLYEIDLFGFENPISQKLIAKLPSGARTEN